jgi:uncharacterized protein DUF898
VSEAPTSESGRLTEPETAPSSRHVADLVFTGRGAEYFRIWVVNLLLTLLTLGVYSAWAKVRKARYLRQNTRLDGHVFDFHGKPLAIFRGRLVALVLFGAYTWAFKPSGGHPSRAPCRVPCWGALGDTSPRPPKARTAAPAPD